MRDRRDNREIQTPRQQRMLAVADWRLLTTIFMIVALLVMLWRGEWVGICSVGVMAWLMNRSAAQIATQSNAQPAVHSDDKPVDTADSNPLTATEAGLPPVDGSRLMLERIGPVWLNQFDAMDQILQAGSHELLSSVSSLDEGVTQLGQLLVSPDTESSNKALAELVHRLEPPCTQAMHALQFGDRLSQMLHVLKSDIQRYVQQVHAMTHCKPSDAEQWLDELSARYTTEEQRQAHVGELVPPRPETVDFF